MQWNMETYPYVVTWFHATGERLTRSFTTQSFYATRREALDAINLNFGPRVTSAIAVHHTDVGKGNCVATRKRGAKIVIK